MFADDIANHKFRIAGVFNLNSTKHLANNNFEMLIGNVLTLASENFQNLVHDIALGSFHTLKAHQILEINSPVGEALTSHNFFIIRNLQLFIARNFIANDTLFGWRDNDLCLGYFYTASNRRDNFLRTIFLSSQNITNRHVRTTFDLWLT